MKFVISLAILIAMVCPPTGQNSTPQNIDPNQVNYKILCNITAVEGDGMSKTFSACDPDGDPIIYQLLQFPTGMELWVAKDPNEIILTWTAQQGTWYVDLQVSDIPAEPNDTLFDRGSITIVVRQRNNAPMFGGCR